MYRDTQGKRKEETENRKEKIMLSCFVVLVFRLASLPCGFPVARMLSDLLLQDCFPGKLHNSM